MRARLALVVVGMVLAVAGLAAGQEVGDPGAGGMAGAFMPPLGYEGLFSDVPNDGMFAPWVEQLYRDGITSGCATGKYCPTAPVLRQEMAIFLERAMRGGGKWPTNTMLVYAVSNTDGSPNSTASGTLLLNAMSAIPTTGTNVPSATNPWAVVVGAGTFDLGSGSLLMRPYVTLRGAGAAATIVKNQTSGASNATVRAVEGCAVQDLTIRNDGPGTQPIGLRITGAGVLAQDLSVLVGGSTSLHAVGVSTDGADQLVLRNVKVRWISGVVRGIEIDDSQNLRASDLDVITTSEGSSDTDAFWIRDSRWGVVDHCRLVTGGIGNSYGHGIMAISSILTVTDSYVEGYTYGSYTGYGMYVQADSTVTVMRSYILGDQVPSASGETVGCYVVDSDLTLVDSQVEATWLGIYAVGATEARTVRMVHSRISADTGYLGGSSYAASFRFTEFLLGGVSTTGTGTASCVAVISPEAFHATGCP